MVRLTTHQDIELQRLRQTFLAQLPERVQAIETLLAEALAGDRLDGGRMEALFHLAHRLCGSAGIYGYQAVHLAAAALEDVTQGLRDAPAAGVAAAADLCRLLATLKRVSTEAGADPPAAAPRGRKRARANR